MLGNPTLSWGRGSEFGAGIHHGATGQISAVSPAERCARLSCLSALNRTQGCRVEVGKRGLLATSSRTYACPAQRPHRCLATAASGNKGCLSRKGGGGGSRPQTRSHPPTFPVLSQWLPREGEGLVKAEARMRIRSFSAVLRWDTTRSIPRGGAGARRLPGCQPEVASSSFPSILEHRRSLPPYPPPTAARSCFGALLSPSPAWPFPNSNHSSKPD